MIHLVDQEIDFGVLKLDSGLLKDLLDRLTPVFALRRTVLFDFVFL